MCATNPATLEICLQERRWGSFVAQPLAVTFNEYRGLLFAIAYRMLGSRADADDVLQDAFLKWQQASIGEIESPRRYLVTIVSRLCINHLKSARVKREQYVGQWLPEPLLTDMRDDPAHDLLAGESISMAFMLLLQRLSPDERAIFILREVFDYEYAEISAIVNRTQEYCRQILHRAHEHVKRERTRFEPSHAEHKNLLQRFLAASLHGDMDGLLSVLAQDVMLYADGGGKASAVPNTVFGADHVSRLMLGAVKKFVPADVVVVPALINAQSGLVAYSEGRARTVLIFGASNGAIQNIYIISNPDKLANIPDWQTMVSRNA
jgi:RNA polymerase sigma-70 factor (ECF subfamily)